MVNVANGYCQAWKASGGGQCSRRAKDHPLFCSQHAEPIKWLAPLLPHEFTWLGPRSVHRAPASRDMGVEMDIAELGRCVAFALDLEWYDAEEQLSRVFDSIEDHKRAAARQRQETERRHRDSQRRAFIDSELNWARTHEVIWVRTFSQARNEAGGVRHMTRSISPRRRFAETLCGLSVTVQRCTYDEIFKIKTCAQCQHAYRLEQAGIPIPEHPIEAIKRAPVQAALVVQPRHSRQNGDENVAHEVRQYFDQKVAAAVEYLEKVGTVESKDSAIKALGAACGIGETIAGAVVGHLVALNMLEAERVQVKGRHDVCIRLTLRPESEWLDEKPDIEKVILDTVRDADGIADLNGGAGRLLVQVGELPYSVAHVRHVLSDMEKKGTIKRVTTGRRTLWIGLPDMEVPDDVQARYDAWLASKEPDEDGHQEEELPAAQPAPVSENAGGVPKLTREQCEEVIRLKAELGNNNLVAERLGVTEKSVRMRLKKAKERFGLEIPPADNMLTQLQENVQSLADQVFGSDHDEALPRPATPAEVAALDHIRQVNVPDTQPAAAPVDEGELNYDQLADAMLNRVGFYLAERDDVIAGQEVLIAELRADVDRRGSREEIDELARQLAAAADLNAEVQTQLRNAMIANRDYQAANKALEAQVKDLTSRVDQLSRQIETLKAKTKTANVSEDARKGVLGAAREYLRGGGQPKSDS